MRFPIGSTSPWLYEVGEDFETHDTEVTGISKKENQARESFHEISQYWLPFICVVQCASVAELF